MTYQSNQPGNFDTVAIIGCGTIGRRIALLWVLHDKAVTVFDINHEASLDAQQWIQASYLQYRAASNCSLRTVTVAETIEQAAHGAWMIVECTPEVAEVKRQILGQIDQISDPSTIIATNSSSFRSSDLISHVSETGQGRVLNCHYFFPPEIPLVELMPCDRTAAHIFDILLPELRAAGLHPIIAKVQSTGLIANRVWAAIKREVMMVLAEGVAKPDEIDMIFRFGFQSRLAPCEMMDQIGLHTVCDIEDHYIKERGYLPECGVDFIRQNYVAKGTLGRMSGRGLHNYTEVEEGNEQGRLSEKLVGAWELVEYATTPLIDPGCKHHPLGNHLSGIIMYTPTGYTSVHIQLSGMPPIDPNQPPNGIPRDLANAGMRYLSYSGPFWINEEDGKSILQHHVAYTNLPSWQGGTQRRFVRIEKEGNTEYLILWPDETTQFEEEESRVMLRWRRLPFTVTC